MKRRLWISGGLALLVSGCGAAVGVGGGGADNLASTKVKTSSTDAVRSAVMSVFKAEGFAVLSQSSRSITFSKAGGRSADIMWTTINNPNPVMIRPTVSWRPEGAGEVWVGCEVEIAQQDTSFGETVRQPMLVGKSAYNDLLRKVKQRVEGGRHPR